MNPSEDASPTRRDFTAALAALAVAPLALARRALAPRKSIRSMPSPNWPAPFRQKFERGATARGQTHHRPRPALGICCGTSSCTMATNRASSFALTFRDRMGRRPLRKTDPFPLSQVPHGRTTSDHRGRPLLLRPRPGGPHPRQKVTSVALTEAYLDRLEKLGPKLNAVVLVTRDLALKEAREADKEIAAGRYRGPLHGIPYGAKDLFATKGLPTSWGAEPFKNQVFDYDATLIKKLREAGAVLVAKLAMVELAGGFGYNNADASFTGPGRNPWNLAYWSGGSSSGPGERWPRRWCRLPSARRRPGRSSRRRPSAASAACGRPMAVSAVTGRWPCAGRSTSSDRSAEPPTTAAWSSPPSPAPIRSTRPARINCSSMLRRSETRNSSSASSKARPSDRRRKVRKNFEESLKVLRQFADIDEAVEFPDLPYGPAVSTIIDAEGASAFRELIESGRSKELRAPQDRWGGYAASMVLAVDYLQAQCVRVHMKQVLDALYAKYDALLAPARGTVSLPINLDFDKAYPGIGGGPLIIQAGNLVGQPALSVPNGFGLKELPTGIQFTGRVWSEAQPDRHCRGVPAGDDLAQETAAGCVSQLFLHFRLRLSGKSLPAKPQAEMREPGSSACPASQLCCSS